MRIRALCLALGAAASGATAQVNRGFELNNFTAYKIHDGNSGQSSVVSSTDNGLLPTQGSRCARLQAGVLSQSQAESLMDLPSGRLAQLYLDLGGESGQEFDGDYNVLSVCLPCGDYNFDFVFESGDDGSSNFLDHAFVVNSAGIITVLDDTASGLAGFWQAKSVSHPGGNFYFVSANGGDTSVDGALYIDDTFITDPGNGSFESGFTAWTVNDAGAGHASTVFSTDSGLPPTHGFFAARLQAGAVDQSTAESILKLPSGTLGDLYLNLGGEPGQEHDGDYLILSQPMKGTNVQFDYAYEGGDFGNSTFLDHAFTVDSEGQITVLVNSKNIAGDQPWQTRNVIHSGGNFFFVIANGGDTAADPELYLDRVSDGPRELTSVLNWNGTDSVQPWGSGSTETYGQVFVAPGQTMLKNMKFFIDDDAGAPISYRAYVYRWNGSRPTGSALFVSPTRTTDGIAQGFETVVIPTPGTILEADLQYVAFLSVLQTQPTSGGAAWGQPGNTNRFPGTFVFTNVNTFGELFTSDWTKDFLGVGADLACEFDFGPAPRSTVPNVNQFVAGPSNQGFPWNTGGDFRYQQVFAADQFCGRGGIIERFSYRVESIGSGFGPSLIQAQIWLGYTNKAPGNLSTTFNNNFTSGKTLVKDGFVNLKSNGNGGFDVEVNVNDVFNYNPDLGNLLMEVKLPPGQPLTGQFDAAGYGVGQGGTPWTDRLWANGQNSVTGSSAGDDGPVTEFTFIEASPTCYADCNEDGNLNILDFVCFQQAFTGGNDYADCNNDGALNILDFVCYQQQFQGGCN